MVYTRVCGTSDLQSDLGGFVSEYFEQHLKEGRTKIKKAMERVEGSTRASRDCAKEGNRDGFLS